MKCSNLTIYTYEKKNGKTVNGTQVITKIPKVSVIHRKTKSISTFNKTASKGCMTVPNQTPKEIDVSTATNNQRVKTAQTNATPLRSKKKQKIEVDKSKTFTATKQFNSSKLFSKTAKLSQSNSFNTKPKSPFARTATSETKKVRQYSKEKVENSIGAIIQLKKQIAELAYQPSELDSQKKEIIDYFQDKINELNQIKEGIIKEKNIYEIQNTGLQAHFDKLKSKYDELRNQLEIKKKQLQDINDVYIKKSNTFDATSKNEMFICENYYSTLISHFSIPKENQENPNINLSLSEIDDISLVLRIILGHLGITIDHLMNELFSPEEEYSLSLLVDKLYDIIKQNCTIPHNNKILLSIYLDNLGRFHIPSSKPSRSSSKHSSKRTSNSKRTNNIEEDAFSFETLKMSLVNAIGTIPTYTSELIPIYKEKVKNVFEKCKEELVKYLQENDIGNFGIVSFNNFKAFLNSNSKIDFNYYTNNHREILDYIFYIMKERNSIDNFNFYDLNYQNLLNIIDESDSNTLLCSSYIDNIREYMQKNEYSFEDFISPIRNHIIANNNSEYIEKQIFEFYLRIKRIIRQYQIISEDSPDSLLNLTELNEWIK